MSAHVEADRVVRRCRWLCAVLCPLRVERQIGGNSGIEVVCRGKRRIGVPAAECPSAFGGIGGLGRLVPILNCLRRDLRTVSAHVEADRIVCGKGRLAFAKAIKLFKRFHEYISGYILSIVYGIVFCSFDISFLLMCPIYSSTKLIRVLATVVLRKGQHSLQSVPHITFRFLTSGVFPEPSIYGEVKMILRFPNLNVKSQVFKIINRRMDSNPK